MVVNDQELVSYLLPFLFLKIGWSSSQSAELRLHILGCIKCFFSIKNVSLFHLLFNRPSLVFACNCCESILHKVGHVFQITKKDTRGCYSNEAIGLFSWATVLSLILLYIMDCVNILAFIWLFSSLCLLSVTLCFICVLSAVFSYAKICLPDQELCQSCGQHGRCGEEHGVIVLLLAENEMFSRA